MSEGEGLSCCTCTASIRTRRQDVAFGPSEILVIHVRLERGEPRPAGAVVNFELSNGVVARGEKRWKCQ